MKKFADIKHIFDRFRKNSLFLDTATTTGWSTIGKAVGFLIPFFIAAWFGVSNETDAFFFAYGFILFISQIFAPVIQSVIVPYIAEAKANNDDVGKFVGKILGVSGSCLFILTVVFILLVKPVLSVITRFDLQALSLIHLLLMETVPLIILLVWTSVLEGTLNAYKKFVYPAISPAFRAFVNLVVIFIFKDRFGIHSVAWGYVLGEVIRFVILLGIIRNLNIFKIKFSFKFDSKFLDFLKIAFYQIVSMLVVGSTLVVDKIMASWLDKGSVSILEYATRLYMIPMTFMTSGLIVVLLSYWSSKYYKFGAQGFIEEIKKAINVVGFITFPIMLLLIIFRQPIVNLAFNRGTFAQGNLMEVEKVWVCYLLGFAPAIVGLIFVKALLVLKKTKILMLISFFTFIMNISLNFAFMHYFGLKGLAISTSLTRLFTIVLQGISLFKSKELLSAPNVSQN